MPGAGARFTEEGTGGSSAMWAMPMTTTHFKKGLPSGLHKLWYPGIRDTSTWSKFGAHGEHGDVFLFSNLGVL